MPTNWFTNNWFIQGYITTMKKTFLFQIWFISFLSNCKFTSNQRKGFLIVIWKSLKVIWNAVIFDLRFKVNYFTFNQKCIRIKVNVFTFHKIIPIAWIHANSSNWRLGDMNRKLSKPRNVLWKIIKFTFSPGKLSFCFRKYHNFVLTLFQYVSD